MGITGLLFVLFGLSDLLILLFSKYPNLYPILDVPLQRWEEIVIYAPFGKAFSFQNLFPIAPSYDPALCGLSVYPIITFFILGIVFKVCALGNINLYLLLLHSIMPIFSFWLIYIIILRYISRSWSVLLAFLGVTYFSGFHYIDVIRLFVYGSEATESIFPYSLPEICRAPFPCISLILFLIPFYLTIRDNRLLPGRILVLSVIWGLQLYIYPLNFLAGTFFFGFWVIYARCLNDRAFKLANIAQDLGKVFLIFIVLATPYYLKFKSPLGQQLASKTMVSVSAHFVGTDWGIFLGYIFPVAMLLLAFYLFHGDYQEIFYRVTPVLLVLVVEILMATLHLFLGSLLDPMLYYHRISNIFFRYLYFVPFFYFISLPKQPAYHHRQGFSAAVAEFFRAYIQRLRVVYCVVGISLISLFVILNHIYIYKRHENQVVPAMQGVLQQVQAVNQADLPAGALVVYEDLVPNLMQPAVTGNATLLANIFGNFVDDRLILERIILFAKLFNWSEDRLVSFLTPNETFQSFTSYKKERIVLDRQSLNNGLGYWLVNYNKVMDSEELNNYRENLLGLYRRQGLDELLQKHPVKLVLVRDQIPLSLEKFPRKTKNGYWLVFTDK